MTKFDSKSIPGEQPCLLQIMLFWGLQSIPKTPFFMQFTRIYIPSENRAKSRRVNDLRIFLFHWHLKVKKGLLHSNKLRGFNFASAKKITIRSPNTFLSHKITTFFCNKELNDKWQYCFVLSKISLESTKISLESHFDCTECGEHLNRLEFLEV